jgi:hypothetical protein
VISAGNRFFSSVPLACAEEQPHPAITALIREVRRSKSMRQLAKSAAFQLRHLVDVAAFEYFLNGAAMAAAEQGVDPHGWLEARVRELKQEQETSREEQARINERTHSPQDAAVQTSIQKGARS